MAAAARTGARILSALAGVLLGVSPAAANDTGMIVGRVFDATSGAPLPLAMVVLQTVPARWWTSADDEGRFAVPDVAGGSWNVAISAMGFETVIGAVPVGAGETTEVSASLRPGADTLLVATRRAGPRAPLLVAFPRTPELRGEGLLGSWSCAEFPRAVAFTPDGQRLALRTRSGLALFRPRDGRLLRDAVWPFPPPGPADLAVALGPDGVLRLRAAADSLALVQEPQPGIGEWPVERLGGGANPTHLRLTMSGDRRLLAAWGAAVRRPTVWRLADGATLARLPSGLDVRCAAFAPDSVSLLLGGAGGEHAVERWEIVGARRLGQLPVAVAGGAVRSLAVDPKGRFFVVGGADSGISCWSLADFGLRWQLSPNGCCPGDFLEISPDGALLVTGLGSGLAFVDTGSGAVVYKLKTNHERGIRGAAFAPDGETLATVGYDSRLALWSVERLLARRQ